MNFCTYCGTQNPEGTVFCVACGKSLANQPQPVLGATPGIPAAPFPIPGFPPPAEPIPPAATLSKRTVIGFLLPALPPATLPAAPATVPPVPPTPGAAPAPKPEPRGPSAVVPPAPGVAM